MSIVSTSQNDVASNIKNLTPYAKRNRFNLDIIKQICRGPKGLIGLTLVFIYALLALLGPLLAPLDPLAQNFMATLKAPSSAHWFGTDQLGRDVFSRILSGAYLSLGIGVGGVLVAFIIGVPLGLAAAWYRGTFDQILMRAVDVLLSFPDIVTALAIVAVLGAATGNVILAVGISSVPIFIRTTRAVALSVLAEPFVEGAKVLGCSPSRIVFLHVLPNMAGTLVTLSSLLFASTLLAASGLSFLGLGVQPPSPEWGGMLGDSRSYIRSHPYLATFPGLFLAIAALAFNLLGEELRSIYDPKMITKRQRPRNDGVEVKRIKPPRATGQACNRSSVYSVEKATVHTTELEVKYFTPDGPISAIRDVNISMYAGRMLAVVGESGSGKSTLLRTVSSLLKRADAVVSQGAIHIADQDILSLSDDALRQLRMQQLSIVFQDASSALNPMQTVGTQIIEAIRVFEDITYNHARAKAVELLKAVKIADPELRLDLYPHQFSGGMKQRVVIAIALAQSPKILLADEPTSALDVTVQQQIMQLLRSLQVERNMAMMFVTHDLGLVARYADDIAVMYAGQIVEMGTVEEVFANPKHPYTIALRASSLELEQKTNSRKLDAIKGEPPQLGGLKQGCNFAPRCSFGATSQSCKTLTPEFKQGAKRSVACHFVSMEDVTNA